MVWREKGSEGVEERDGGSSPTRRASPASTPSLPLPTIVSIINGGVGWGGVGEVVRCGAVGGRGWVGGWV